VPNSAVDDIEMSLRQHRLQQAPGSRTEHHDRKLPLRLRAIVVHLIAPVLKWDGGLSLPELTLDREFGWKSTESNVERTAVLQTGCNPGRAKYGSRWNSDCFRCQAVPTLPEVVTAPPARGGKR
jgi:hypothetical protein